MNERPLLLVHGIYTGARLLRAIAASNQFDLILYGSQLDSNEVLSMNAGLLEEMQSEALDSATALAVEIAAHEPPRILPGFNLAWSSARLDSALEEKALVVLPWVLRLIESIKELHRRRPIRATITFHDINIYDSTVLHTARMLGIPSLHVSHCHSFGFVEAGMPHRTSNADIVAVWSEQCSADFPGASENPARIAVTGSPELDYLSPLRSEEARTRARERMGLPPDVKVLTYASTYDETNSVSAAMNPGQCWNALRSFLKAHKALLSRRPELRLILKLHPSSPEEQHHKKILEEEGVEAHRIIVRDDGTTLAATDLLVSISPSQTMVDALMTGTMSLWVRDPGTTMVFYAGAPWLMQCDREDFNDRVLEKALCDEDHRRAYLSNFDTYRKFFNAGHDGKAAERVMNIVRKMVALTSEGLNEWRTYYDAVRESLLEEGRVLDGLYRMMSIAAR